MLKFAKNVQISWQFLASRFPLLTFFLQLDFNKFIKGFKLFVPVFLTISQFFLPLLDCFNWVCCNWVTCRLILFVYSFPLGNDCSLVKTNNEVQYVDSNSDYHSCPSGELWELSQNSRSRSVLPDVSGDQRSLSYQDHLVWHQVPIQCQFAQFSTVFIPSTIFSVFSRLATHFMTQNSSCLFLLSSWCSFSLSISDRS